MTAIAQRQQVTRISPANFIVLGLALVILIAFLQLPWVNPPAAESTPAITLMRSRDANVLNIERNGLILIPVAAIAAGALGLWGVLDPKQTRSIALLTALVGGLGLVYYAIFFREMGENDLLPFMGVGFWLALAGSALMILQLALPRENIPGYGISKTLGNQESMLALSLIVLVILVGLSNPRYLAQRNISDVLQANSYIAVAAIGMSMVIVSGNIDISVGSLIGVLATVSGTLAVDGFPVWLAWLAPLVLGGLAGAVNGFFVAYLRIPSIVVTLGMLSILKGGLIIATSGAWITDLPKGYFLAQKSLFGVPSPIYFMIVLTILAALWMKYSATGRAIYAVGGNAEAARLSGISERGIVMRVFIINGVFVGIASVLFATQLSIIQSTVPPALELLIITATVVGGVSILGGTGTIIGATLAAILLRAIGSALVFINVSPFWLQAIQGVLILITVLVDLLRRRRQLA